MIAQKLHSGVDRLQSAWLSMARIWHAQRAARKAGYVFTDVYTLRHAAQWSKHLGHLKDTPNVRFLEVGSFEGGSAIWFLENVLTHPTSTITCIDPFLRAGSEARFDHNVRVAPGGPRVTKIKGRSESIMGALEPGSYDAIYIDGSHDAKNVLLDGVAGWRLLKPEGIMIFDDYQWMPDLPPAKRPQMAIDLFLEVLHAELILLHKGRQVIVRKSSPPRTL